MASGKKERLIIALDFGTTYSGIAYCFASQKDAKVNVVTEWPNGESTPKIPSLIDYDDTDSSHDQRYTWGPSVDRFSSSSIVAVKLMLDPSQDLPFHESSQKLCQLIIDRLPKSPVNITTDLIHAMYRCALVQIKKEVPQAYFDLCHKEFVLTVPAVWSDKAKNSTLQAAKAAGMDNITLIKEPEAAALWTMHSLDFSLNVGDSFVVCDAGGGTVDIISYEVVAKEPTLQLNELVPGDGVMAGSLGLNNRFTKKVKSLVGEEQFDELLKNKSFFHAERTFEKDVKRAFRGGLGEQFFINFPMADLEDDTETGLRRNTWKIKGVDLLEIFEPLVVLIRNCLREQIRAVEEKRPGKPVSGIVLVGGFGSSQYLKSYIAEAFPDTQVLQPADAWASVEKGAALSSLKAAAKIMLKRATRHYGVKAGTSFNKVLDAGQPSYIDLDGGKKCQTIVWFIKKGDKIRYDQKIKHSFHQKFKSYPNSIQLQYQQKLYECSDSIAPRHAVKARSLKVNCTFVADLSGISKRRIRKKRSLYCGIYYQVSFDLVITMQSAIMKFSLEIDGEELGSVTVDYDG